MSLRVKLASALARWRRRCQDPAVPTRLTGRCTHFGRTAHHGGTHEGADVKRAYRPDPATLLCHRGGDGLCCWSFLVVAGRAAVWEVR
jgi:hypothetical protein